MIKKYRRKEVELEAILYTGDLQSIVEFIPPEYWCCISGSDSIILNYLGSDITVCPGTWIVREYAGVYYPVRANIFEKNYEEVIS